MLSAVEARSTKHDNASQDSSRITEGPVLRYDNATSGFQVTPYKSGLRATLAMQYQNEAATPATAVVFGLVSGGRLVGLGEDDGVFARDAVIRHDVMLSQEIFPLGPQTHCVVLRVLYANGMAWFNPAPPTF